VEFQQDRCVLTRAGRERAVGIVRAHRLWETYLAEQNIADPELHEMAERLEHAHELAGDLDALLGRPEVDPHGEPIPHAGDASLADPPEDK
jgi:DtxR family Mn-dependent transcriptional regulator